MTSQSASGQRSAQSSARTGTSRQQTSQLQQGSDAPSSAGRAFELEQGSIASFQSLGNAIRNRANENIGESSD